MKRHILLRRWAFLTGLAAAAFVIQACANGRQTHPAAPIVRAPTAPAAAPAKMAPIPNPPEEQQSASPAVVAPPPRPAAKPAAPKSSRTHPPAQTAAAPTAADAARAAKLRASGLEQLDRGAVDRAVTLLRQASQLDPGNELIKRDLERALRISQVVHTKP